MHPRFVPILCCPVTGSDLELIVNEWYDDGLVRSGVLVAQKGGAHYPIINGIPRFVSAELYSGSFGYEWRRWPRVQFEAENIGRPMEGHSTKMFSAITGFTGDLLRDKMVVEFGCGPGRFLDLVRRCEGIGVGIDMSLAVESARENFKGDGKVLIVQGDILNPPFKGDVFDYGYSIGVLHHTPDPALGLTKLVSVVKPKGKIACCVYSRHGFYHNPSVKIFMRLHDLLARIFGKQVATKVALAYSCFAAYVLYYILVFLKRVPLVGPSLVYAVEKYLLVNLSLPDVRWRLLDVFDAITPFYASTHTAEEMRCWFTVAGCSDIEQTGWGDTSFLASKQ